MPVRLIDRLALGQAVEVSLERPARTLKGTVAEIVSEVDAASRTQLVKVHLEGVEGDVLPGTFGRLWVEAEPRDVILVPASARPPDRPAVVRAGGRRTAAPSAGS